MYYVVEIHYIHHVCDPDIWKSVERLWCSSGEKLDQAPQDWRNKFSISSALDVRNKENVVQCFPSGKCHFFFDIHHKASQCFVGTARDQMLAGVGETSLTNYDGVHMVCLTLNWMQMYREKGSFRWSQKVLPTSATEHFCVLWLLSQNWKILHCTNEQQLFFLLGLPWDSTRPAVKMICYWRITWVNQATCSVTSLILCSCCWADWMKSKCKSKVI